MTISELGSLGEVVGAFGLIVTLVFLAMEMRLKRQAEDNRDLEQVQIRGQEMVLALENQKILSEVQTILCLSMVGGLVKGKNCTIRGYESSRSWRKRAVSLV